MFKFLYFLFITVVTFLESPPADEPVDDEDVPEPFLDGLDQQLLIRRQELRALHYGNYPDHCEACGRVPDVLALPVGCHCDRCRGRVTGLTPIYCLLCLRERLNEHVYIDWYGLPTMTVDKLCPFTDETLTPREVALQSRGKYYHVYGEGDHVYGYLSYIGGQEVTCPLGCDVRYPRGDRQHVVQCPASAHTFYRCNECYHMVQVAGRDQHQEDHQSGVYNHD